MNFVLNDPNQKIDLGFGNSSTTNNLHYLSMDSHTNFPVTKYYRQQLSNTFSKIDEDTFNLRIETSHSIVLDVKIDATHINQIMNLSWSPWKSNKSKNYYVLHGGTRTKENDPPVYLHRYVMQLNNIDPPPPTTNNTGDAHSDSSVESFTVGSSGHVFSVDTCPDGSRFSVDTCRAAEYSVDSCRATEHSQSEHTVDTCRATEHSQSEHTVDTCRAAEYSVDSCGAAEHSQSEYSVDTYSATENPDPSGTEFSVDTCGAAENPVPSGTEFSVDHINRDPLDNRLQNLRWATQSEQNQNTDKRKRQCTARELPTGIQQSDIPKWVNYNVETIVQSSGQSYNRCFFRIEKHPRLSKWTSTKSVEATPQEKLAQTYHYMMKMGESFESIPEYIQKIIEKKNFDNDTLMEENGFILKRSMIPKYVNFVKPTEKRGCKFEIAIPGTKRVSTKGAKSITLEEKFNEMMMKLI